MQLIEALPFGEFFFNTVSKLVGAGFSYSSGNASSFGIGEFWADCMKLLLATVIMPIARYFSGLDRGKRYKETLSKKIGDFISGSLVIPVIVSLLSAWIVNYISSIISSMGGVISWIMSIITSIAAIGLSVWAFLALTSLSVGWVAGYLLFKVLPSAINTIFSYCIMLLILIIISSPNMINSLGPCILIIIAIMFIINGLFGTKGLADEELRNSTGGKVFPWF